ncbi:MAG: type II toxin-antitoxin system PemK/MazF family toxin [bacterium]
MFPPPLRRGDVILVDLNPPEPSIQAGVRPAVIVSNDAHNASRHPGVIICPITDAAKGVAGFPGHVLIPAGVAGCTKDSIIMAEQIRLIRRSRIRSVLGHLPPNYISQPNEALRVVLEID